MSETDSMLDDNEPWGEKESRGGKIKERGWQEEL